MKSEPFCCNPKCEYHNRLVPRDFTHLNLGVYTGVLMNHSNPTAPPKADVHTKAIARHKVYTMGGDVQDKLCEVCFEVFKMVTGST